MHKLIRHAAIALLAIGSIIGLALWLGGPDEMPPMTSISEPFAEVDYSDLPPLRTFAARDGTSLAYRAYPAADREAAARMIMIHGSAGSSQSLHALARAFAGQGFDVIAPDIRGHGESGNTGTIDHAGQLEEDLMDLLSGPAAGAEAALLTGFSSGGGFALRIAAGEYKDMFNGYLLLSPFLGQDAPTFRAGSGGWVSVGIPRYASLSILNGLKISAFNHLPVNRFAIDPQAPVKLTSTYNWPLAENFRPEADWSGSIERIDAPLRVMVGADDESFIASAFGPAFAAHGHPGVVEVIPDTGHIAMTVAPAAIARSTATAALLLGTVAVTRSSSE